MSARRSLAALTLLAGCSANELRHVADTWLPDRPVEEQIAFLRELERVMPFYITGAIFAGLLLLATVLNGFEHAKSLGRDDAIRYGAWLGLVGFVALFLAMAFPAAWLPPGHPLLAFVASAAISALGTLLAARAPRSDGSPDRAVLRAGYLAATLGIPLFGLLLNRDVHLVDTTASLLIGQASGLLLVIVLSAPLRAGLVDFLRRRDEGRRSR